MHNCGCIICYVESAPVEFSADQKMETAFAKLLKQFVREFNRPPPNGPSLGEVKVLCINYCQCWGRYFEKVTSYILLVTFRKSNSLHITDYFQEKVTCYSYILL